MTRYIIQYRYKNNSPEIWLNYSFYDRKENALWLRDELNKLETTKRLNCIYRVVERTEKVIE